MTLPRAAAGFAGVAVCAALAVAAAARLPGDATLAARLAATPGPAPADPRPALRRLMPELLRRHQVAGLAIAVVRGRRLAWVEGFGCAPAAAVSVAAPPSSPTAAGAVSARRAGGTVAAPGTDGCAAAGGDTVFAAGALGQPLFAWAVLRLGVSGQLALARPLAGYLLPQAEPADPRGARISALQVLEQTSGLSAGAGGAGGATGSGEAVEPPGRRLAVDLAFDPGTRWQADGGAGYALLQQAVERVSGEPLAAAVERLALAPLGMRASRLPAAAALATSAADYGRFLAAMLDPGAHRDLLPPAAAGGMLMARVPVEPGAGLAWGLGWGIESWHGNRWFFRWGASDGARAFVLGNPVSGDGLAAFTNGEGGLALMDELVRAVDGNAHPLFVSALFRAAS